MPLRVIALIIFSIAGLGLLVGLGTWQVQRLAWKTGVLAQIDARIVADPVPLPASPREAVHEYLPVAVSGTFATGSVDVLTSIQGLGPGFRAITPFITDAGRIVLVDRGFLPEARKGDPRPETPARVTGNLLWPDEVDGFTPAPDLGRNIWFARDLPSMAAALGTEPVLIVARRTDEATPPATPMPVDSSAIPNDHLEYAITWFGLAAIWIAMSGTLIWRMARTPAEKV